MIIKRFGVDFSSQGGALTLDRREVSDGCAYEGEHSKTHPDGWTITGTLVEDYYVWVNEFKAIHPKFGRVWGDFESTVYADSEEGFNDFYSKHAPEDWDYGDI